MKNISTNTFCPNKQFDGGFFVLVSENFLFFSREVGSFYLLTTLCGALCQVIMAFLRLKKRFLKYKFEHPRQLNQAMKLKSIKAKKLLNFIKNWYFLPSILYGTKFFNFWPPTLYRSHILDWILNSVLSHGFQMGMHYSRVLQIHIEVNFSLLSKNAFFPGPNLVKNVKAFHFQKRI